MEEFNLSSGEAIYGLPHLSQVPEYAAMFRQHEADFIVGKSFNELKQEAITAMRSHEQQPAPAQLMECGGATQVRTLRRAIRKDGGRAKATDTERETSQQRREKQAAAKKQEREQELKLKEQKRLRLQEKANADRKLLQNIKEAEERAKRLANIAAKVSPTGGDLEGAPTVPVTHATYHLITTGLLAIPGKVGIVIDSKNTIYVKAGADIDAAVERHFLNRKVARLFNDHQ